MASGYGPFLKNLPTAVCGITPFYNVGIKWGASAYAFPQPPYQYRLPDIGELLTFDELDNQRDWGWAIGFTLLGCDQLSINGRGALQMRGHYH